MATKKFMSPGVFTREIDQSFLAQGVAGIGAAVVGRTLKGPAFVPTIVDGFDTFAAVFDGTDPAYQLPYTARNYLKNAGTLTVVRVLGSSDGTTVKNGYVPGGITAIVDSGSDGNVLAVVHHSGSIEELTIAGVALDANDFVFKVGSVFAATASFLTSSANYVGKVLNTDPTKYDTYGHYVYQIFGYAKPAASASWAVVALSSSVNADFEYDYQGGVTSWIKSQLIGGVDFNLFRFHTLGHGRASNDEVKVVIENVKTSINPAVTPYGTFDVVVRDFYDTDDRPKVIESFIGCTLDPSSPSFIQRQIGDNYELFDTAQRKFVAQGNWPLRSQKIWIEMATTVAAPPQALPWGHRGYTKDPYNSGSLEVDMPLAVNQVDANGNLDPNIIWGISFVSGGIADRMRAQPRGYGLVTLAADADFSLGYLSSSYNSQGRQVWSYNTGLSNSSLHSAIYASASLYAFALPFQGGFDGWDLRVADPTYLQNSDDETVIGVVSLKRAIDTIANPDAYDLNLLAIPGVHNLKVSDYGRAMVNSRMDAMYVMDVTGSTVTEVVGNLQNRQIDDNYTACYYPDEKILDRTANKVVRVAPSVSIMGAYAFNDAVGQPWFAPAGLNRGGLGQFDVIDVADRLSYQDRSTLYDNRINPIATFPNEGIAVWGQKTLQVAESALNRVNVRRLLIFAKKTIAAAAKLLVFEPNDPATWQRFTNSVNPILKDVQQKQGLEAFKVVMDSSVNTADLIDRNVMTGKIFLAPTRSAEFIDLSFVITNSGVSFGE